MANTFTLVSLIARHGSFSSPVTDFAGIKKNQLAGLEKFLPQKAIAERTTQRAVTPWRAAGALIKNSLHNRGGHLQANQKKLFYVRIPKAANTSCAFSILKNNFPDLPANLNATQLNLLTDCWLEKDVRPELNQQTGFTVVRHPLHRLVSVYRDFFERRDTGFIYSGYLFDVLKPTLSFDQFVLRISRIPDKLKDQHFRPQHCFLGAYLKGKIPVRVFKLEQPGELQNFLSGYGMQLPHLNRSLQPYVYRSYYSGRTLALARNMYASDFLLFNYDQ